MSRKFQDQIINKTSFRIWQGTKDSVDTKSKCLVMLHGIGSNKSSFDTLANGLPQSWSLIAWDAPGYGSSAHLSEPFPDAGDYAKRLKSLLQELKLPQITLLGHSLGTLIAARFARLYPQSIKGLILLASAQGYSQPKGELSQIVQTRLDDLDQLGSTQFARIRAQRLMYQPEKQPEIQQAIINAMSKINREGYGQAVHMLTQGDLKTDVAHTPSPSLVLVGDKDVITPPEQSQNAHRALTHASSDLPHIYHEVPDAGHALHQQKPAEVAAKIVEFENLSNPCPTEAHP